MSFMIVAWSLSYKGLKSKEAANGFESNGIFEDKKVIYSLWSFSITNQTNRNKAFIERISRPWKIFLLTKEFVV